MPINIIDAVKDLFKSSAKIAKKPEIMENNIGSRITGGLEKAIRGIGAMFGIDALAETLVGQPTKFYEYLGEIDKRISSLKNISDMKLNKLNDYLSVLDAAGYNLSGPALKNLQLLKTKVRERLDKLQSKADEVIGNADKMRTQLSGLAPQSTNTLIKEEKDIQDAYEKANNYLEESSNYVFKE